VSATGDTDRPWLDGVFLHAVQGKGRAVGTDGTRIFISTFEVEGDMPAWMAEGLILSGDGLRARIAMILKANVTGPVIRISYAKGLPKATLTDEIGDIVFRQARVEGEYPDYDRIIRSESFVRLDEFGTPQGSEWEPVGLNSKYLKVLGDIAKTLEAGLPKAERSENGMAVRAYNSHGNADAATPLVFDFMGWPGALLLIQPMKVPTALSAQTAALLAPAARGTVAALRAHATRWLQRAEEATDDDEKAAAIAKAEAFQARIAAILQQVPAGPAITDESAVETSAEPVTESEQPSEGEQAAGQQPTDEGEQLAA
jgi:hypothetical protein